MAIKIIKKRHAPEMRAPAPLVEEPPAPAPEKPSAPKVAKIASSIEELWAAPPGTMIAPPATECSFCGRLYAFPCHGKREDCLNAQWKRKHGG